MWRVRWFKLAAIGAGILIAFLVVGSVIGFIIHTVTYLVLAALVVGAIAVAIKVASSRRQVSGKKAERDNAVMAGMVATLSAADLKDVAAYYASQKLKPASAKDKELAAAGQKIYRGGIAASAVAACAGCHGPSGAGIPAQYPHISGQFAEYIEAQLKAFRAGTRTNDPNGMMRTVAARMNDREIQAVSEYVAGLR